MSLTLASITVTCLVFVGIFKLLVWHFKRRHLYQLASRLKGPPALPIVGSGNLLIGNGEYIMRQVNEWNGTYPSLYRLWIGPVLFVVVTDPDQMKAICLSPKTLDRGDLHRRFGGTLFGTGIVTAPPSIWRARRKLIQPTFNKRILDSFVNIFVTQAKILTEKIERNSDGQEFRILDLLLLCTFDMVCESTMGVKIGAQTDRHCHYVKAMQQVVVSYTTRLFSPWLHPDFIFYNSKLGKTQLNNLKYMHDFADNVIESKRNELFKRDSSTHTATETNEDDAYDSTSQRKACLNHLLSITNETDKLSHQEIRDEVTSLIASGSDTTAITMSFIMLMLASYPAIQDKVYEELYKIYGDADSDERPVKPEDLMHMKYMECVFKETMRLFPVIPFFIREVTEDLNIGGQILPKGCNVLVAIQYLQRNGKYWTNPLNFDPERFSPEENAKQHPDAFMAFGAGPRNCVGLNYAMMSMKTVMATLLRRYILKKDHIVPAKDIRLGLETLMEPVEPITLRIEKR